MSHRQRRPRVAAASFALGCVAWGALLLVACQRPESAGPAPAGASPDMASPASSAPPSTAVPDAPAAAQPQVQATPSPRPTGVARPAVSAAPEATPASTPATTPAQTPQRAPAATPPPATSAPAVVDPGGPVAVAATKPGLTRVGVQKCGICHKRQRESWAASAHARRTPPLDCESCHGAGSGYVTLAVMKDAQRARAAGLVQPEAAFCQTCHRDGWQADMLPRVHAHKLPATP